MTRITTGHMDDPSDSVDAALNDFEAQARLRDQEQKRKQLLEDIENGDDADLSDE
jgi:hypothetical protein